MLSLSLASAGAFAQVPAPPPGAQPGQIERQFQPSPTPAQPGNAVPVPAAPEYQAPANAEQIRFTLKAVVVEGATVYPDDSLAAGTWGDRIGQSVTLADVFAWAQQLTVRYRNDGYILSRVLVPQQDIADGTVRLRAVEGFVAAVQVDGDADGLREAVDARAQPLTTQRPLTAALLERQMLLINDLPGVRAVAVLKPSQGATGAADVVIQVTHTLLAASAEINNRGSRSLGPWRLDAQGSIDSPGGVPSRLSLQGSTTPDDELRFIAATGDLPIGVDGLLFTGSASFAKAHPDPDRSFGVAYETESTSTSLRLAYPLLRSLNRNVELHAQVDGLDGSTDANGARLSTDRIRSFRFGARLDVADAARGVNLAEIELSHGLNAFGARRSGTEGLSNPDGRSDYSKATFYLARVQGLTQRWSLLAALQGQRAFDDLLTPERFSYGGSGFGRGYDPSELLGDDGAAAKLEARYDMAPVGTVRPLLYGFYEIGKVWRRHPVDSDRIDSGATAGLGVRFDAATWLSGYVELAKPLTRDVAADGDRNLRGYVGLRMALD
ncbi:two-partner secretion system transporter CdrB [soil metagenome]